MTRPALERASPSGAVGGSYVPLDHQAVSVLMDDGTWVQLDAVGWVRDIRGGWRIQLLWYADSPEQSQREDWFMYNPGRVRLVRDALALTVPAVPGWCLGIGAPEGGHGADPGPLNALYGAQPLALGGAPVPVDLVAG